MSNSYRERAFEVSNIGFPVIENQLAAIREEAGASTLTQLSALAKARASENDELQKRGLLPEFQLLTNSSENLLVGDGAQVTRHRCQRDVSRIPQTRGVNSDAKIVYEHFVSVTNIEHRVGAPMLSQSQGLVTSRADNMLASELQRSFNCHAYTCTVAFGHVPEVFGSRNFNSMCLLSDSALKRAGYTLYACKDFKPIEQHENELKEGDILVIEDRSRPIGRQEIHSAVVIRSASHGGLIIRQKFDAEGPVVDLNLVEFGRAYINTPSEKVAVWRK